MAKIHREKKNGRDYYRLVVVVDGIRKRAGIGYGSDEVALRKMQTIATKLESLKAVGEIPDPKLQAQLNEEFSEEFLRMLAKLGLVKKPAPKLKEFLDLFIETKVGTIGDYTVNKMKRNAKHFVDYFGNVSLNAITTGDAKDYKKSRLKLGYAEATVGLEIKHGRQFFKYAIEKRYLFESPFADVEIGNQVNAKKRVVIEPQVLADVIDAAPTSDWQVMLAILRWTGCRKSESLLLKWEDILWDQNKIDMPSPKTAHLGIETRMIPLFSELKPYLEKAFLEAPEGSVYVVNNLATNAQRSGMLGKNLQKPFHKIIRKSGHEPWPRPFQNIRVTRENELVRRFAGHLAESWIGHSEVIAKKHYLDVTESDFESAVEPFGGQMVGSKAEQGSAPDDKQAVMADSKPILQHLAVDGGMVQNGQVLPLGFEPRTY